MVENKKRMAVFIVLIGFFIPSIFYFIVHPTENDDIIKILAISKGGMYEASIFNHVVVIKEGEYIPNENEKTLGVYRGRIEIKYRHICVLGVIIIFFGFGLMAFEYTKLKNK